MEATEKIVSQNKELELASVEASPFNPRKSFKGEGFDELKKSIKEYGIIEPLIVRPKDKDKWTASTKRYEIVAGERRFRAAKDLKLEKIPVKVVEISDQQAQEIMLLENLQREDLSPLEEASALEALIKLGETQEELAKKIGKSQPWVANRVRLLKAPENLKALLISGQMSPQHLMTLLPFCDKEAFIQGVLKKWDEKMQYSRGVSVEELRVVVKDVLLDDSGKYALTTDKKGMGYHMSELAKDMDLEACRTCDKAIETEVEDEYDYNSKKMKKHKYRICLEAECFRPRVNAAKKAIKDREQTSLEKQVKSGAVKTDQLRYGVDYKDLDYVRFPREWCKGCPKMQTGAGKQRDLSGQRHEAICLKPRCLDDRVSYFQKEIRVLGKKTKDSIETGLKAYLKTRGAGLKKHELQFIFNAAFSERSREKIGGLSEKQLEELLLRSAIKEESSQLEYGDSLREIDELARKLPFKIEGEFSVAPPAPPKLDEPKAPDEKDPAIAAAEKASVPKTKKVVQEKRVKRRAK